MKPKWTNINVRLGDLKPWTHNPKFSTKAQAKRLLDSFERFGQVSTVAVGPGYEVYDGHQRLSALLTLHGPDYELAARQSDRALTDEERKELVVTLHAGAVGSWDWAALSEWDAPALQGWGLDKETLDSWSKDAAQLNTLIALPPNFEPVGMDEQSRLDEKNLITCPECGHEFRPQA